MELFSIERYEGDLYSAENNTEKEFKNLAKLLRQARGRGRKRSREGSNSKQKDENKGDNESGIVLEAFPKINQNAKKKDFKEKRNKLEGEVIKETKKDKHIDKSKSVGSEHDDDDAAQMLITGEQRTSTNGAANNISKANSVTLKMKNEDENEKHLENTKQKELSSTMSKQTRNKEILKPQLEMTVIGGDSKTQKPKGVQRTLPKWLANPSFFCSDVNKNLLAITEIEGLHSGLVQKLEKQGVKHFFPVQESVIPAVLSSWEKNSSFGKGGFPPQDICVCAPTGSGKTLAYVLPVIEVLKQNTVRRIEALVIVPTKDLATQVWHVFNIYVQGTGLSVGLANGLRSLQKEQQQLGSNSFLGYSSNVNILVATPGRLVEHISSTDGFSLQFLRFLIIDEADRLLAEPYFGWLDKVYESVFSSIQSQETHRSPLNTLTPLKTEKIQRPLQKLLFSATLTQNPEKLALLQLYKPRFFTVSKSKNDTRGTKELNNGANEEFDMLLETPATLEESMYICNSGGKPLVLLHLLTAQSLDGVLCFTSSVESTHRLHLVVKHFGGIGVQEFSSNLTAARRQAILNNFKCGKTQIIICSDAMARGLDVPAVKYVISYDPPVSSKTYVHRVGRTARAGKTGSAITLLHDNEVFHFKKMLKSLKKDRISKHSIKDGDLECLMEKYKNALEQLKTEMASSKKQIKRMRR